MPKSRLNYRVKGREEGVSLLVWRVRRSIEDLVDCFNDLDRVLTDVKEKKKKYNPNSDPWGEANRQDDDDEEEVRQARQDDDDEEEVRQARRKPAKKKKKYQGLTADERPGLRPTKKRKKPRRDRHSV